VRQRWNGAGLLFKVLRSGGKLSALFRQRDGAEHGWRGWLKTGASLALAWKTLSKVWR